MAHLTAAASEEAFKRIFEKVRDAFTFEFAKTLDLGLIEAGIDLKIHLEGGAVDLRAGNTVFLDELDIKWDKLDLTLGFDIPELCIGDFCLIPTPFGCLVEVPGFCVFSDDPDFSFTLPLGGFTSELTLEGRLLAKYFVDPARPAGMNDWDAQDTDPPVVNQWRIHLDPIWVDVDPIDIADTVGDLFEAAFQAAIDNLLFFLPDDVKDVLEAIFGSIVDLIRFLLDIPDDIQEWISDLLNVSFGLVDLIGQVIIEYLADEHPLVKIEDPYPLLPEATNPNDSALPKLVPVKVPIRDLNVFNDDVEMTVEANIGPP